MTINNPVTINLESTSKYNPNIQAFRGIAIIAVIIIHTIPKGEWQIFCRPFVNYAVALFLFLSGYLTPEKENWNHICKKRILRVLIPYVIWSFIYCLPLILKGNYLNFIIRLASAQTCYPFYYIFVYIQFVLLTPCIFKLAKSRFRILGWLITPLFIISTIYIPRITHVTINFYLSIFFDDLSLGWFCFYYLGLIIGNKLYTYKYNLKNIYSITIFYFLSILFQMIEIYYWCNKGITNCASQENLTAIISSMLFSIIAFYVIKNNYHIFGSKILIPIGKYSFGIYLNHIMIINIFHHFSFYNNLPTLLNSATILLFSYLLCYFLSIIIGSKYSHIVGIE